MLFNSYAFLFGFLPVCLLGYQVAGHFNRKAVVCWLALMSLAFYAYWRPPIVFLLLASIVINYLAAALISRQIANGVSVRVWLWLAIVLDLALLGYFKYLFPLLNFASHAAGSSAHWTNVILPLGISFFTFTQIAFLVDLSQGAATQQDLASYALFVTFFPHLVAGPILHHKDMMPQFQQRRNYQLQLDDVVMGLSWFIMGLGKKVLLADHFALTANYAYGLPGTVTGIAAWRGVLSYALQLYFDFSGYSDMALGLARMFSIDFPLNFSSPYKATNIIDFWQRWHITLTQYITDYVYSPLQFYISGRRQAQGKKVSRKAQATPEGFVSMIAFPIVSTFLIAGAWHGAGLQYIVFGTLHGIYLTVNHGFRLFFKRAPKGDEREQRPLYRRRLTSVASVLLTFLCVLVGDVFFRSDNCSHAFRLLAAMFGAHGAGPTLFATETARSATKDLLAMVGGFVIVWALPNTQQILGHFKPALAVTAWDRELPALNLRWTPTVTWAIALSCVFFLVLVGIQQPSRFLYFQF